MLRQSSRINPTDPRHHEHFSQRPYSGIFGRIHGRPEIVVGGRTSETREEDEVY
jgi:hypothetical protein